MTSNALLRSGRGELYEGGIRVSRTDPLFVFGFHKGGTYRAQISG